MTSSRLLLGSLKYGEVITPRAALLFTESLPCVWLPVSTVQARGRSRYD
jgi:hypothetical protein